MSVLPDPRIILEQLGEFDYYMVHEVATGLEIGGVIKRYRNSAGSQWCAMTTDNARHDVFGGPTEGTAATKEEAAQYLLPLLREPNIEGRPGDEYGVAHVGDECYVWNFTTNTGLSGALPEGEANRRVEELRDPVAMKIVAAVRCLENDPVDPHGS
jgi:hypothetical protein